MSDQKKRQYFGTDGIRGTVGQFPLLPEFVTRLGYAAGRVLSKENASPTFVIGRDTRESGEMLQSALTAGLLASGAIVMDLGVIPTPGVAFMAGQMHAEAGVVISASHNPVHENGIKFFNSRGFKLDEAVELEIETTMEHPMEFDGLSGHKFGRCVDGRDLREQYVDDLVDEHQGFSLSGLTLALDCANGAASWYAPQVFSRLGAKIVVINAAPTGKNINAEAGSEHVRREPQDLNTVIRHFKADFGVVFDGDADRVIFVDETGNLVDGDHMLAILADYFKGQGNLLADTVVSTTMRNGALVNYFAERKINFIETRVGDKYVIAELKALMEKSQPPGQVGLGGEQSGHIIMMDDTHATCDGLRSAVFLSKAFLASGKQSLSELAESIHKYPQVIASAVVAEKIDLEQLDDVQRLRSKIEGSLPGLTRLNLRYSGTEPKVRLMMEADTRHTVEELADRAFTLCESVQQATGTPKGSFLEVLNVTQGGLIPRPS